MVFVRSPLALVDGAVLRRAVRSIGIRRGRLPPDASVADIEQTLASMVHHSARGHERALEDVIAWVLAHQARVIVPRLAEFAALASPVARAFFAALGTWLGTTDVRWRALTTLHRGAALPLYEPADNDRMIAARGEDPRFVNTALRVPAGAITATPNAIDDPVTLAARHANYRQRVIIGPTVRADLWAELDRDPDCSAATLARRMSCAYETARSTRLDWLVATSSAKSAVHVGQPQRPQHSSGRGRSRQPANVKPPR
jgi:hypothetical protein